MLEGVDPSAIITGAATHQIGVLFRAVIVAFFGCSLFGGFLLKRTF